MAARIVELLLLWFSCSCTCSGQVSVGEVRLLRLGPVLVCRSEGIHFKPTLTWSFIPKSTQTESKTTVQQEEGQLYHVSSSVHLHPLTSTEYTCNISTAHGWSSATYRTALVTESEASLPCAASNTSIKSLIWSFNDNERVLTRTGSDVVLSEAWRQSVSGVSESGLLLLKNLGPHQLGLFSCVHTTTSATEESQGQLNVPGWIPVLVAHISVLLIFGLVIAFYYCIWGKELLSSDLHEPEEIRKQKNGKQVENEIIFHEDAEAQSYAT